MSRTYKDRRKKKTKGNPYPDRMTQIAIGHAVAYFDELIGRMHMMSVQMEKHREMLGGNEYNNISRSVRTLRESKDYAETVLENLKEDHDWITGKKS